MFELLAKQYELAKINEAKDSSTIQILDTATPSDKKSKPKRAFITLAGFFMGLLGSTLLALLLNFYKISQKNDTSGRWKALTAALGLRN